MRKICALLLGLILPLGLFSACGKPVDEPNSTTEITSEYIETETTDIICDDPTTVAAETTTSPDESSSTEPEDGFREPKTIKEAIALYASAVDKTLKNNPIVTKRVLKVIERPLQGDDSVKRLFGISVAGYGVEKVICEDLFGEGDVTYVQPAVEALQASLLRESDVSSFTAKTLPNGDIELHIKIKDSTNPAKPKDGEGPSPIGNVTWDFTSLADIRQGILDAQGTVPGLRINIATIKTDFYNCQGKAVIRPDGSFASLTHIADNGVRVEVVEVRLIGIRLGGGEWGGGIGHGTITYVF